MRDKNKELDRIGIIRLLEKDLKYKRFIHTLGVANISAALAMRYGADTDKAEMAGLLHDCAKSLSLRDMLKLCEEEHLALNDYEKKSTALLHSKAGSVLARKRFGCDDDEILQAIRFHTTGRPAMSLLEKIVFTADYIEPGRFAAPGLPLIRELAFEDLDRAVMKILEDTLSYLEFSGARIDPQTQKT